MRYMQYTACAHAGRKSPHPCRSKEGSMNFKEDDLILGTVKKIEGTTAYVELDNETQGSLSFSEIAPGRIRNIREFISLGKKIVCKVLRVRDSHVELTLRRVTSKERQLVLDSHKKRKCSPLCSNPFSKIELKMFWQKFPSNMTRQHS